MRIWLLQRSEPTPHDNDGKQRLMRTGILSEQLSKRGHEVIWWTSTFDHYNRSQRHDRDIKKFVKDKYYIQYLKGIGYKKNVSISRIIENNIIAKKFKNISKKYYCKPDLILSSIPTSELSIEAIKFAKKNNIPVVIDIRDMWPDVFLDVLPNFFKKIYPLFSPILKKNLRMVCSQANYITGITNEFVNWGIEHSGRKRGTFDKEFYLGYLPPEIDSFNLNVGLEFWNKLNLKKRNKDLIVSYFGVLGKVYDFQPIIEAAKILQRKKYLKIKFVFCGSGEKLEDLRKKTKKLDNVFFPGWVYRDQIASLLNISDIGIAPYMPIPSYLQTISNKAAEYLSGSLPIALSVDEGPLNKLLKKENAGIFYSCSGEKLADELISIYNNKERLLKMQENAFKTFENYLNGKVLYSKFMDYLEDIVYINS